jgi:hypothetical protein
VATTHITRLCWCIRPWTGSSVRLPLQWAIYILNGHSPNHTDHPGTPLQLLCALIIFVQWLLLILTGSTNENIFNSALANTESYITTISLTLLAMNASAAYYLGRRIFQTTKSIILAIFIQSSPLAFWSITPRMLYVSPEALLIFSSMCLLGLLASLIFYEKDTPTLRTDRMVLLSGIACGFSIAVKITFIPMIGMLFLFKNKADIIKSLIYTALALCVFILPIAKKMGSMLYWFYSLGTHSGIYGTGNKNILDTDKLVDRITHLFETYPFFYLIALLLAASIILQLIHSSTTRRFLLKSSEELPASTITSLASKGNIKTPFIIFMVCLLQTLIVLKHPGDRYMTPVLPLAFIGAAWLTQRYRLIAPLQYSNKWPPMILLALACFMTTKSVFTSYIKLHDGRISQNASLASIDTELKKYTHPLIISSYPCILPECALMFGASFTSDMAEKITPALSNFAEYNLSTKRINKHGEGWLDLHKINKYIEEGRRVFLISPQRKELNDTFKLELILGNTTQSLYKVTGISDTAL